MIAIISELWNRTTVFCFQFSFVSIMLSDTYLNKCSYSKIWTGSVKVNNMERTCSYVRMGAHLAWSSPPHAISSEHSEQKKHWIKRNEIFTFTLDHKISLLDQEHTYTKTISQVYFFFSCFILNLFPSSWTCCRFSVLRNMTV